MRGACGNMARGGAASLALLLAVAITAPSRPARAQAVEAEEARYRELIRSAVAEFDLGQWQEAIALFRKAHRLRPSARTHRGLGQALFEARDYVQAIPHLEAALSAPDGTFEAEQRGVLTRALNQALSFIGQVRLSVQPADAVVTIDGQVVQAPLRRAMNPGEHTVGVRAAGYVPFQQRFVSEGGREQTIRVQLIPEGAEQGEAADGDRSAASGVASGVAGGVAGQQPGEPDDGEPAATGDLTTTLGLVSAGLAVASFGTAVVLWRVREDGPVVDWQSKGCVEVPTLNDACLDVRDTADAQETGVLASLIAGGILTATAVTLLALPAPDQRTATSALRCGVGPGTLLCRGTF